MLAQQDIRRRIDGSIDIDFYRHRALMERRAAMAGFFRGAGRTKWGLVAAALLATALYATSLDHTGANSRTGNDGLLTALNQHANAAR